MHLTGVGRGGAATTALGPMRQMTRPRPMLILRHIDGGTIAPVYLSAMTRSLVPRREAVAGQATRAAHQWAWRDVDPSIKTIAETLFDEASAVAKAAAEVYAFRPERARPLERLPLAAKAEEPSSPRLLIDGVLGGADRPGSLI